jgi:hypothetical protein
MAVTFACTDTTPITHRYIKRHSMFYRAQMLAFFQLVDDLESKLDSGDFGTFEQGYTESELLSMADGVLQEIAGGLSQQTGFTKAQLIVSSHAIRENLLRESGIVLTHEQLMERSPELLASANNSLSDHDREGECLLTGFLDAHGYWLAATYYADAGMEEPARKCIEGARYWKQRLLDSCRD